MAKPVKTLELYYPMIQLLIKRNSPKVELCGHSLEKDS